ncbi:bifunctional methylenetetrahydrofolate dehydrogenase/methenyltetrahydrofolate cyclohydrolase FolD [Cohnella sp. LGH]|uniref:Bifunctional protein FolD n=1 Tax=Cohnella phaseoli TaxID=456490 RepID=A0A3D9KSQ7_9BACL|nr:MULTISPECIES: bifunctional methylenetetrahydrofolate dehydrogenase/methenyltetrahydrofolate cyclohydrolase FolD [Cohnella]QTH44741.1 bifunctional methylenetetrahydrofolate dehydrogenase/methenyltetrahydrofolate cyclohydrolase FolD [Cohnella sp. LGH]RED89442.1 methylenetetrahydrofolate dehydrogenase (NADP+)/methenyltetrahydrofolate cyclohydrolase [Cohnella phaseoli]
MSAQLIEGKKISDFIREEIKLEADRLKSEGVTPGLVVILVGEDPASQVYVRNKAKACEQLGYYSEVVRLPAETSQQQLLSLIDRYNSDDKVNGILVQLPLPKHIEEKAIIDAIAVEKDVDGFHPESVGNLMIGDDTLLPCTPAGVIELLKRTGNDPAGKHAVVIGRSNIVGKPVAMLLLREHATVTICHSRTPNLPEIAKQADILVAAVGVPKLVKKEWVKPGAVVIDVGVNRLPDGKLCGDVDFDDVVDTAGWITPVPGGVGPMTITMLMANTLKAAKRSRG